MKRAYHIAAICIFGATPVFAETAAQELMQSFGQKLIDSGAVTMVQNGEDLVMTLDYGPVLRPLLGENAFDISTVIATMHPQGDGKWEVSADQSFSASVSMADLLSLEFEAAHMHLSGAFDEKAPWLFNVSGEFTDIRMSQTIGRRRGSPPRSI